MGFSAHFLSAASLEQLQSNKLTGSLHVAQSLDPVGAHLEDVGRSICLLAKVLVQGAATKAILVLENHKVGHGRIVQRLLG